MADAITQRAHQLIAEPVFRWPSSGWWFTAIGALVGSVLLVAPDSIELSFPKRLLVCSALILAPVILLGLLHTWRRLRVAVLRAQGYSELTASRLEVTQELDRANSVIYALVRERQERTSLRIAYCYVYDDKPMIALKPKRGFRPKVGDSLTVVSQDLGHVLGTFEITEDGGNEYRACSSGPMDALWLGYMKQAGTAHSEAPPRALAMRLSIEEDGDDKENTESTT